MAITYSVELCSLYEEIGKQLRLLEIPGKLKGHHYLVIAISQAVRDPERITYITKGLYLDIARMFGVTGSKVERAIRVAIRRCWDRGGREALDQMAGFHLHRRPTNSEFIDLAASYFRK